MLHTELTIIISEKTILYRNLTMIYFTTATDHTHEINSGTNKCYSGSSTDRSLKCSHPPEAHIHNSIWITLQ